MIPILFKATEVINGAYQILFIIDLPALDNPDITRELTPFGEELSYFLKAKQLDDGLIRSLKKYDWTETRRYGFVHSM